MNMVYILVRAASSDNELYPSKLCKPSRRWIQRNNERNRVGYEKWRMVGRLCR